MRTAFVALLLLLPAQAPAAPAARAGDPTSHGGAIVFGSPNVFIGGRPAARVGDFASCPQSTPTNPPVAHVGGPVSSGSPTVLVNGRSAARAGDLVVETVSTSVVAAGAPTVLVGGPGGLAAEDAR